MTTTNVNLKELTTRLADKLELTKADSEESIRTVFELLAEALTAGEEVAIPGFGKFVVAETAARTAHNPRTREEISVPAGKRVSFKASTVLKRSVKGE